MTDPFPNNTIDPSRFDPVALRIQSAIPLPNLSGLFNNYLPSFPAGRHVTIPAVKIDENIGSKGKLSFYWSYTHIDNQFGTTLGAADGLPNSITTARGSFIHSHTERLNYDHTLSSTLLLHVGIGYQQNNFFDDAPELNFNAETTWGLKGATVNRNVPVFQGLCGPLPLNTCGAAGGMKTMGPSAGQSHSYWEKPASNASITWVRGNHTYKAGAEMFLNGVPTIPYANTYGNYSFSPNETSLPYTVGTVFSGGSLGFPYASFLLGAVDQFSIAAPAQYKIGKTQFGMFAQDAWKVSRKLTVNYGLRWDWGGYYKEQYNRGLDFSATTPNPSVGGQLGAFIFEGSGPGHCNCSFVQNYPYAFGPRLGFAYQLAPKTVVRGGWGVVYGQTGVTTAGVNNPAIAETNTVVSQGLGLPVTYLRTGIPAQYVPQWPVFSPGVVPGLPTGNQPLPSPGVGGNSGIGYLDPHESRPPRQNQWSIGIQREITSNLVAEANYVGNRGVWWGAPGLTNLNAITPQMLQQDGLNINNPADQTLLLSTLSSSLAAQRGFNKVPYPGFSTSNTVAQALRPFPQFGTIPDYGPPLGKTWYDSLQAKVTQRLTRGTGIQRSLYVAEIAAAGRGYKYGSEQHSRRPEELEEHIEFPGTPDSGARCAIYDAQVEFPQVGVIRDAGLGNFHATAIFERPSYSYAHGEHQYRQPVVPKHAGEPRTRATSLYRGHQLPLLRPRQNVCSEPGGLGQSGAGPVRYRGGILLRLPLRTPPGGDLRHRPIVPLQ